MFSSIFGKRRSSPVENETPPIPGARTDDGFVVVNPTPPRGLYPQMNIIDTPPMPSYPAYPGRPAPPAPVKSNSTEHTFHYLQGVPFSLSKDLQMATRKDDIASEIGDLLAFTTRRISLQSYDYNFDIERAVLKEC